MQSEFCRSHLSTSAQEKRALVFSLTSEFVEQVLGSI